MRYNVRVTARQYDYLYINEFKGIEASNILQAKSQAAMLFWDIHGEEPNTRIVSFTVTEYII